MTEFLSRLMQVIPTFAWLCIFLVAMLIIDGLLGQWRQRG